MTEKTKTTNLLFISCRQKRVQSHLFELSGEKQPAPVFLWNSAWVLVLGPHLCTWIWERPMINLLKKTIVDLPIMIRLKRIPNALLIICRVHWEPSTRISGFLCRSYWPEFYYVYHVGKGKENLFNIRMF